MKCYCCNQDVTQTRHVQLRGIVPEPTGVTSPDDPAWITYEENTTYRSAFVCPSCYGILDSPTGTGVIDGRVYGIAGRSRGGRAAVYDQAKYDAFIEKKARDLGINPS
jgi:hypothetical protein